ncbi:MAG: DUF732 domain-containing protein [Actinomycetota bacterium]
MNLVIARRIVWTVAAASAGWAGHAYWTLHLVQLLVAFGIFVLCLPVDRMLFHEQEARRPRTPFGPVAKFGLNEDAMHRLSPNAARTAEHVDHLGRRVKTYRFGGKFWSARLRLVFRSPLLIAAMPLLIIPVGIFAPAPDAHANPFQDYGFLSTLDEYGVYYSSDSAAIAAGLSVCSQLDRNATFTDVVRGFMRTGWERHDAATLTAAAIGAYCPKYIPATDTAAGARTETVLR